MKPEFALSLSFDGIRLLQRAAGGWREVGTVDVDTRDLARDLRELRKKAGKVKNRRVCTKLIIPDDQIKYMTIPTGDVDMDAREEAARKALDGATPYPVDALAFDISAEGTDTHIAAVARETLTEAEAFALEHKFNPVSFVAAPDDAGFLGEPFFGETACVEQVLRPGIAVKPDGVRVVVVTHDPVETAEDTADTEAPVAPASPVEQAEAEAVQSAPEEDNSQSKADTPTPDKAKPAVATDAGAEPVEAASDDDPSAPSDAPAATDEATHAENADTEEPQDAPEPEQPDGTTPQDAPASDPTDDTPSLMGFATRRRAGSEDGKPAPLGGVTRTAPPERPAPRLNISADVPKTTPPKAPPALTPQQAAKESLRAAPPIEELPTPTADPAPADGAKAGGFLSRRKGARKTPPPPRKTPPPAVAPAVAAATQGPGPDNEAQRMTVFGARAEAEIGGKPKFLGLILTAILLIFLAGVAAWASVFLDDGLAKLFPGRERTLASTLPDDAADALVEDVGATEPNTPTDDGGDAMIVASLNEGLSSGLTAEDAAVLDALRDPQPDPAAPEDLDSAALEARYAVTGIWPKAPEIPPEPTGLIVLEDLYVTGIDPVSPALDAIALPGASDYLTDVALPDVASPPAPGTNFALDDDGRVVPTEDGAVSPDGFTVFLGPPPLEPPDSILDRAAEPAPRIDTDSIIAQVRPRARPDDLVEQNERATLGGLSRSELALLRPRLRPAAPQEVEPPQDVDTSETEDTDLPAEISPLAVAQSIRPETRPRNFDRIVARATRDAVAPQRVAAVAPRTVSPSIPSSASVTREATVRNAINLGRVNLIGVYGTPSNRRALVRLKNGRYQKVKVGDRFDGGRVSAIGDSELRYQKGNRNLVLKMPSG
ncbi:MAG: hypothetical protein AB3N22_03150 [Ruegeria sp.]